MTQPEGTVHVKVTFDTKVTLYVFSTPMQTKGLPLMGEGIAGMVLTGVTESKRGAPPPQVFEGLTITFPEVTPTVTVIELLP
jgi:hypothetical protein